MSLLDDFKYSFNIKNINSLMKLFSDDVVGVDLFSNEVEFRSISELKNIYTDLFEINPNIKCNILESIETDSNLVIVKSYYDFACGARSKTVWNAFLSDGKIQKILHFSKKIEEK